MEFILQNVLSQLPNIPIIQSSEFHHLVDWSYREFEKTEFK